MSQQSLGWYKLLFFSDNGGKRFFSKDLPSNFYVANAVDYQWLVGKPFHGITIASYDRNLQQALIVEGWLAQGHNVTLSMQFWEDSVDKSKNAPQDTPKDATATNLSQSPHQ